MDRCQGFGFLAGYFLCHTVVCLVIFFLFLFVCFRFLFYFSFFFFFFKSIGGVNRTCSFFYFYLYVCMCICVSVCVWVCVCVCFLCVCVCVFVCVCIFMLSLSLPSGAEGGGGGGSGTCLELPILLWYAVYYLSISVINFLSSTSRQTRSGLQLQKDESDTEQCWQTACSVVGWGGGASSNIPQQQTWGEPILWEMAHHSKCNILTGLNCLQRETPHPLLFLSLFFFFLGGGGEGWRCGALSMQLYMYGIKCYIFMILLITCSMP